VQIDPSDAASLVVFDATTGHVDQGIVAYLDRRRKILTDAAVPVPITVTEDVFREAEESLAPPIPLAFPEPLQTECLQEISDLKGSLASAPATSAREANIQIQSLFVRFFAVLLHGYRSATFFPGVPPQYSAALSSDVYIDGKARALAALASASKGKSSSDFARSFITTLCETQMMSRLLQRHTSVYLRPFHSLTSMLSTSPSLAETKKWAAPTSNMAHTLVVPPPGYPLLKPWQVQPESGTRLFPPTAEALPPPLKQKRGKKDPKPNEIEMARRWTSGEVADALAMDQWEHQELELLVAAHQRGEAGPKGDDVGGSCESSNASAMSETAAILSAASEAAGANSNPVIRRRAPTAKTVRRAFSRAKKEASTRWWRANSEAGDEDLGNEVIYEKVHKWLMGCITTGALPLPVSPSGGSTSSIVTNVNGIPWFADDDGLINLFRSSAYVRNSFVYALQTQILLSAGLSAPLSGASTTSTLQLQPLLQLGVTSHTVETPWHQHYAPQQSKGPSGSNTARTLLNQYLPAVRFQRLAAMCASLLAVCQETKDFETASALLQVSFFFFTEPQREAASAFAPVQAALASRREKPAGVGGAWNSSRQYLYQDLSGEPIWKLQAFWEAYIFSALAVELQQLKLLHLQAQKRATEGQSTPLEGDKDSIALSQTASGTTYIFNLVSTIMSPMLQLGFPASELQGFISRISKKFRVPVGEERTAMSLIESLVTVEASAGIQKQLNYYATFARGDSFLTASAMTAGAGQAATAGTRERVSGSTPAPPLSPAFSPGNITASHVPPIIAVSTSPVATPGATQPVAPPPVPASAPASAPAVTPSPIPAAVPAQLPTSAAVHASPDSSTVDEGPSVKATDTSPPVISGPTTTVPPVASVIVLEEKSAGANVESGASTRKPSITNGNTTSAGSAETPIHSTEGVADVPHHLWSNLAPKEAEAAARQLAALRRFPVVDPTTTITRMKSTKGLEIPKGDVALSSVMADSLIPAGGLAAEVAKVPVAASAPAPAPPAPAPTAAIKNAGSKMPIVKKFGSMGLSVFASTFAAALPGSQKPEAAAVVQPPSMDTIVASDDEGLLDTALHALTSHARSAGSSGTSKGLAMSCLAFRGHAPGAAITSMSHDPEDHRVVTGGIDGRVTLWDMTTRDYVHTYDDHSAAVTSVKICGDVVVSASQDGTVRVSSFARLAYGLHAPTASGAGAPGFDDEETDEDSAEASKESPEVPAGAAPAAAVVDSKDHSTPSPFNFPLPTLQPAPSRGQHKFMSAIKLTGHSGPVSAVDAFERIEEKKTGWFSRKKASTSTVTLPSTTNYVVVTGGTDGTVRTWSLRWKVSKRGKASGAAMQLSSHTNLHKAGTIVEQVKLSADGRLCVSVGRDGRVGVVDIATSKTWIMTMPTPTRSLFGRTTAPAPIDPLAVPTGLPLVACNIDVHARPVTVTTCGTDGTTRVWDLKTGAIIVAFACGSPVWCFGTVPAHGGGSPSFNADGTQLFPAAPLGDKYLVTGHEDGIVRKWDSRSPLKPMAEWHGHPGAVTSLSTLGDKVVTGSVDGMVRLWDASSGLSIRCDGHTGNVISNTMSYDYMLSAAWDGTLRCWFPAT
jgi:WD40 repeat protein